MHAAEQSVKAEWVHTPTHGNLMGNLQDLLQRQQVLPFVRQGRAHFIYLHLIHLHTQWRLAEASHSIDKVWLKCGVHASAVRGMWDCKTAGVGEDRISLAMSQSLISLLLIEDGFPLVLVCQLIIAAPHNQVGVGIPAGN